MLRGSSQECHEDATRKTVPWNLSLIEVAGCQFVVEVLLAVDWRVRVGSIQTLDRHVAVRVHEKHDRSTYLLAFDFVVRYHDAVTLRRRHTNVIQK